MKTRCIDCQESEPSKAKYAVVDGMAILVYCRKLHRNVGAQSYCLIEDEE